MSTFPGSPRILKSGLVLLDPDTTQVVGVITLQYNPDSLKRSLQVQGVESDEGTRSDVLRLTGPPVETISFTAEIDASDPLEFPDENARYVENGLHAQLAALETLVYPDSGELLANHEAAQAGSLEITPTESPLLLFVWSKNRVLPVRITSFSINEQSFDVNLNPIRASVDLELRVLNVNDVGFDHKAGSLFLAYQQQKERLAEDGRGGALKTLGLGGIP